MPLLQVTLPRNCLVSSLISTLSRAQAFSGAWSGLEITVPNSWVHPAALAFLDCWGRQRVAEGKTVRFAGDPENSLRYLSRMNLFQHIGFAFDENFKRWGEAGRFMPLTLIQDAMSVKHAVDGLCDLALRQFDNAEAFLPAMEWAVNEVVDNILVHSETAIAGAVCAQYTQNRRLHVGICDMGRGVLASLSENRDIPTHAEALQLAVQRGVTRDRSVGQGNGLAGTRVIVEMNKGAMGLWSGDASFVVTNGRSLGAHPIPRVSGTGVSLTLHTDNPVDLSRTFIAERGFTFLDEERSRISEQGGLVVKDECIHQGHRDMATPLRRKVTTLLRDMDAPFVIDFAGVNGPSSSFLDELLAKLVIELGETDFRVKVQIVGMSQQVKDMANVVIAQRRGSEVGSLGEQQ